MPFINIEGQLVNSDKISIIRELSYHYDVELTNDTRTANIIIGKFADKNRDINELRDFLNGLVNRGKDYERSSQ